MAENINNGEQYGDYPSEAWKRIMAPVTSHVDDSVYLDFYDDIMDKITSKGGEIPNFSGISFVERPNMLYKLIYTIEIYWTTVMYPEGAQSEVSDIIPIWIECHSFDRSGDEVYNDFDMIKLRSLFKK